MYIYIYTYISPHLVNLTRQPAGQSALIIISLFSLVRSDRAGRTTKVDQFRGSREEKKKKKGERGIGTQRESKLFTDLYIKKLIFTKRGIRTSPGAK